MDVINKFYDSFVIFAGIQFLLFACYLVFTAKGKRISNHIISFIFLSLSFHLSGNVLHLNTINSMLFLVVPPAIYFYTKSLIYTKFKFKISDIYHLIPAIVYAVILISLKIYYGDIDIFKLRVPVLGIRGGIVYDIITDIQLFVYIMLSIFSIKNLRCELEQKFSSIQELSLNWLKTFVSIYLFAWYFGSLIYYLEENIYSDGNLFLILRFIDIFVVFLLSNYVVFKGLKYPQLFNGIEEKPKYQKSNLDKTGKDKILNRLFDTMKHEKPYLNPTISLNQLSERIDVPPKKLSQVINEELGKNFYDFINQYRVEEAKQNIQNNLDKTFLEILFDAGFNSKAVFNNAFKKHAGMTPREYKKVSLN